MSNATPPNFPDFGKLVPGFDFLQNLTKQAAGSATQAVPQLPNLGNWIAPTLNVEELDKRIQELKAVQFWLDQNAMALKATIQALEVQKMTLATLKGMNFNMGDLASAFQLTVADPAAGAAPRAADAPRTFSGLEVPATPPAAEKPAASNATQNDEAAGKSKGKADTTGAAPAAPFADPMQWWGALTQQFQAIATDAMQDAAGKAKLDAGKSMATGLAQDAVKTATDMARGMAESASKSLAGNAGWPTPAASKTAAPARASKTTPAAAKPKPTTKAKTPARKAAPKTPR